MAAYDFRTVAGFVQFDPREGEAGGKDVRNITVRNIGLKDQAVKVGATIWPSHAHIEINKGDFVVLEGKFSVNQSQKEGEPVTYYNLSVSSIANFGTADTGTRVAVENAVASEPDTDDIPF